MQSAIFLFLLLAIGLLSATLWLIANPCLHTAASVHYFSSKHDNQSDKFGVIAWQILRSAQKIRRWIVLKRTAIVGFFC